MQLFRQEWQKLQAPTAILAAVIMLVLLLLTFAQSYKASQLELLQTQQNLLNIARQHYQSSGLEKSIITEYLPQYKALIQQGFVGEENRADWLALLKAQKKTHQLFDIKYSLDPQEIPPTLFAEHLGLTGNLSGFVLHSSVMKLDLDMLHELDILQLTESLANKNITPFMLCDCEITRIKNTSNLSSQLIANLHAKCVLDWLTISESIVAKTSAKL